MYYHGFFFESELDKSHKRKMDQTFNYIFIFILYMGWLETLQVSQVSSL